MRFRRVISWTCLALLAGGLAARPAEPAAAKQPEAPTRYIFVIDNSSALKGELEPVRKTVAYLLYNGFYGKMKRGDPFEIWTFNDKVKTDLVPVQYWTLELSNMLASQNYEILKTLRFEKTARMDRLMDAMQIAIHRVDSIVFFVISAGETVVVGSPVDRKINVAYGYRYEELLKKKKPFLTTLASEQGRFTSWAVTAGDEKVVPTPIEYPAAAGETSPVKNIPDNPAPKAEAPKTSAPVKGTDDATSATPAPRTETPKSVIAAAELKTKPAPTPATDSPPANSAPPKPAVAAVTEPVKILQQPIAPPEIQRAPVEPRIAKTDDPKPSLADTEQARKPNPPVIQTEAPKPIPTGPTAKVDAQAIPIVQPKIDATPIVRTEPTPTPQAKVLPVQNEAPPPAPAPTPAVAEVEIKKAIISETRPSLTPESVVPQPAAEGIIRQSGPTREPAPAATTIASTPARPGLSPVFIAGVGLLAVAAWIGVLLFRRSRPAAPSLISRSMPNDRQ